MTADPPKPPEALDRLVDKVLAYHPKPKTKPAKQRNRRAAKIARETKGAMPSRRSLKTSIAEMIENACSVSYLTAEPLADELIDLVLRTFPRLSGLERLENFHPY
jgi:hypothetical protein